MSEQDKMVLRAEHLVKKYGKRTVVNDVSFDVKQGERKSKLVCFFPPTQPNFSARLKVRKTMN